MNSNDRVPRRAFLKATAGAAIGAGVWTTATSAMRLQMAMTGDRPAAHGMLVVGEQSVYLSHLPIFGTPHDYQLILEATFTKTGATPQADYFNDRKRTGKKIYTLEPERFVLTDLAAATPRRSFKANIYRDHFERFKTERAKEAALIGEGVDVTVTRVIHFHKFDPKAAPLAALEYLLFGKASELFLAHMITRPPDFDQVLAATTTAKVAEADLAHGVSIIFPDRKNLSVQKIKGALPVTGQTKMAGGAGAAITLKPGKEFYLEEGELAG
ncbi:MAG: hypothetical protein ABJA98_04905 [Acidobacteriota bacterium]